MFENVMKNDDMGYCFQDVHKCTDSKTQSQDESLICLSVVVKEHLAEYFILAIAEIPVNIWIATELKAGMQLILAQCNWKALLDNLQDK